MMLSIAFSIPVLGGTWNPTKLSTVSRDH